MATVNVKPSSTSATSTAFCADKVSGPGGFLHIDGNGKITADNGTLDNPKPNAFSLVQIQDCPHSTPICRSQCYVHQLERYAPATHALYQHNSRMIREILVGPHSCTWAARMADYIEHNCKGGFRWHVSGDIFSLEYAKWIAKVVHLSPNVRHWIYTRSFPFIGPLLDCDNLAINLSCDTDNWREALYIAAQFELRCCFMTTDGFVPIGLKRGDVIFPDYALRGGTEDGKRWFANLPRSYRQMVCPVDYSGKAENRRCGPCNRCLKLNQPELAA